MTMYNLLDIFLPFLKNMITKHLLTLFCVFILARADGDNEIKRGVFPYMAYIYYPDETIKDASGNRFLRGAVLIKTDWLITSGLQLSDTNDTSIGFPKKTLLARLGATTIDDKFTANEDEDEQEREVIQIVRPYNHSTTQWWHTDITLMKTLLPFNLTSAVSPIKLTYRHDIADKTCSILVYAKKYGNLSKDKVLMHISVDILAPSIETCGSYFYAPSMTCASDSEENKNPLYHQNYCIGNSGGPLICENYVVGLQTYIDNDCKQPHLYQLISAWHTLISCSTENKCKENQCANICIVTNKDTPDIPKMETGTIAENTINVISESLEEGTVVFNETSITYIDTSSISLRPTKTTITEQTTILEIGTETTKTTIPPVTIKNEDDTKLWPKEKKVDEVKKLVEEDTDKIERKTNVEAQQHDVIKKVRNSAEKNINVFKSLFSITIILSNLF